MDETKWKSIIEAIGVVSIVASLIFVGMEVRQSSMAANDASLASDGATITDIQALVLTHPDVWRRGCAGEALDPTEELTFSHIYHAYQFQYFFRWLRGDVGLDVASAEMSIDNMAMNIHRYPGFRQEWQAHGRTRYHVSDDVAMQVWRRLVDARVAEYASFEPEPLEDLSRCGLV